MKNRWADDWRRDALERKLRQTREEFLKAQSAMDDFNANLNDPPPLNTCNRCVFKNSFRCGRTEEFTGFDPVYGHRLTTRSEMPHCDEERGSRMPWRCGPKGRYFKSWSAE